MNLFPTGFKWALATAAYQVEGATGEDGKGATIWDVFCRDKPSRINNESNADIACDSYHNWKRDIEMVKETKAKYYRFSISWARILPNGTKDFINEKGIRFYRNFIDELVKNGIEPMVVLLHNDLPQALQDKGGWINFEIVQWFTDYAEICYREFGPKVKYWITINEPWATAADCYGGGDFAPAFKGHAEWSAYLTAHHQILAHAYAYRIYEKFRNQQKGQISIALNAAWYEPGSDKQQDIEAAGRALQFELGWFAHPIFSEKGGYPSTMKEIIGKKSSAEGRCTSRLPEFTKEQLDIVRGSADYFAFNHYFSVLARQASQEEMKGLSDYLQRKDSEIITWYQKDWYSYGGAEGWVRHFPEGYRKLLNFIKTEYNNPRVFLAENGCPTLPEVGLNDTDRTKYFKAYITAVHQAITQDGCNIEGYTAWSLMDNFEWLDGYSMRFGVYQVDFEDPARSRQQKESAKFLAGVFSSNSI